VIVADDCLTIGIRVEVRSCGRRNISKRKGALKVGDTRDVMDVARAFSAEEGTER
jgi:hypothetical protein